MKLRPRQQIGSIPWKPECYGHSELGQPLEFWRPRGTCEILVFAGIHGEEPETTLGLSRALRQLSEPPLNCAVVLAANPDGLVRGTRGNARGVDLNRNFPTKDWRPDAVAHRSTMEDPQDILLSPGSGPASEKETQALVRLIGELQPRDVVALHAPLACIDDAKGGPLAQRLAQRTGLPLVEYIGYPTPGSFGTWGGEQGIGVVTYEFPLATTDAIVRDQVPVLVELIGGFSP